MPAGGGSRLHVAGTAGGQVHRCEEPSGHPLPANRLTGKKIQAAYCCSPELRVRGRSACRRSFESAQQPPRIRSRISHRDGIVVAGLVLGHGYGEPFRPSDIGETCDTPSPVQDLCDRFLLLAERELPTGLLNGLYLHGGVVFGEWASAIRRSTARWRVGQPRSRRPGAGPGRGRSRVRVPRRGRWRRAGRNGEGR